MGVTCRLCERRHCEQRVVPGLQHPLRVDETFELELMETKGLTYKQAHKRAQFHEKVYRLEDWLGRLEAEVKRPAYEPVEVIEKTTKVRKKKKRKNHL